MNGITWLGLKKQREERGEDEKEQLPYLAVAYLGLSEKGEED